jgi:hypothetical protein
MTTNLKTSKTTAREQFGAAAAATTCFAKTQTRNRNRRLFQESRIIPLS